MAALAQPVPQEVLVEEAVKAVLPPRGVRFRRVFFDSDHTGDAAIRVIFAVSRKIPLTKQRIATLVQFDKNVSESVRHLRLGPLTYVRFVDGE